MWGSTSCSALLCSASTLQCSLLTLKYAEYLVQSQSQGPDDNVSGATAGICRSEASAWLLAISIICHHRKYFVPTIAANPAPVTALSPTQSQSQSPGTQYPGPRYCMHDESHVTLAQTITGVPTMQHHRLMFILLCGAGLGWCW